MNMLGKLVKRISKSLSPKKGLRATKKVMPKVARGALLIGSGIVADKAMGAMEDHPSIVDNAADDSNIINESFSFIRMEDLKNGSQEGYTMGPARISTWVMVALLLIGATYPSYIIYKKLYRCLIRMDRIP